jgi:hypothetical protein
LTLLARGKQPSETGEELGPFEGLFVGEDVEVAIGVLDGEDEGVAVGEELGPFDGLFEGEDVGVAVGVLDGEDDGGAVGENDGLFVGKEVGQISAVLFPTVPPTYFSCPSAHTPTASPTLRKRFWFGLCCQ